MLVMLRGTIRHRSHDSKVFECAVDLDLVLDTNPRLVRRARMKLERRRARLQRNLVWLVAGVHVRNVVAKGQAVFGTWIAGSIGIPGWAATFMPSGFVPLPRLRLP